MFQSRYGNSHFLKILPVIDLRGSVVVRAVGGHRAAYRPLISRLTQSTEPVAVANAIRERFGWEEFYVADLDAIGGSERSYGVYDRLHRDGFRLWLDAGIRDLRDAECLAATEVEKVVVGLETVLGPAAWQAIVQHIGSERVVFSLDLFDGRPCTVAAAWESLDVHRIVEQVVAHGGRQMIVLDTARVGTGSGTGTEALCETCVRQHPELAIYAGGGVRDRTDMQRLARARVAGVLVASAVHDGALNGQYG